MPNNNQKQQTSTSTQIRNFYSDGMSYLNTSFFNTNFSFKFYPFISKDGGRSVYDLKNGLSTTVNFEGAYALYNAAKDIIDGKINELNLPIPCAAGAILTLERKLGQNGIMETIFSISKNNIIVPFRFPTVSYQVKENGQVITKTIESGLGAFMKTVEGYLTGINSDRHLDKLTDDFAKLQGNNGQQPQQNQQPYGNNGGNGYRKNYNNNNYRKPYNGNGNQQYGNNQGNYSSQRQQDFSTYQING